MSQSCGCSVQSTAGLAFQCKIIMCSAVAHGALASKGCRAGTGDTGPDTVFVLLSCLQYCLPSPQMGTRGRKGTFVNSQHFLNASDNDFDCMAPSIVNCKGCNWVSPNLCVEILFSATIFLVSMCLLCSCETNLFFPVSVWVTALSKGLKQPWSKLHHLLSRGTSAEFESHLYISFL